MSKVLLQLRAVTKTFPGVVAVDRLDLDLAAGDIHALVGGNGSGKSTTVGMLSGNSQPDGGEIRLRGAKVLFKTPRHAKASGIATIFQERQIFPDLTVAENIFLNDLNTKPGRWIAWRNAFSKAQDLLDAFGVQIDSRRPISHYGVGIHQIIEIIRGMIADPALLILDEPTASLSRKEVIMLFGFLRNLKKKDVAILLIVHNLDEVLEIADRISILRDGRKVAGELDAQTVPKATLIAHMLGTDETLVRQARKSRTTYPSELLEAQNLPIESWDTKVAFKLGRGEILAIVGLLGAGAREVAGVISGARSAPGAVIKKENRPISARTVRHTLAKRLVYLPADRKRHGLFMNLDVKDNIFATILVNRTRSLLYWPVTAVRMALNMIHRTNIKPKDPHASLKNLSGGNQQKVLFSRILAVQPEIMVLENPTVGVDVSAQMEIHNLIAAEAASGVGILLVTNDFREAATLADRVLIIRNGRFTDELTTKPFRESVLLALAGNAHPSRSDIHGPPQ